MVCHVKLAHCWRKGVQVMADATPTLVHYMWKPTGGCPLSRYASHLTAWVSLSQILPSVDRNKIRVALSPVRPGHVPLDPRNESMVPSFVPDTRWTANLCGLAGGRRPSELWEADAPVGASGMIAMDYTV